MPSAPEVDRGLRRGIFEYAHKHGPWIFLDDPSDLGNLLRRRPVQSGSYDWSPDGAIVSASLLAHVELAALPLVVISDAPLDGDVQCRVCSSDEEIGRMGALHLVGFGLRHFAYCGPYHDGGIDARGIAFHAAIEDSGHSISVHPLPADAGVAAALRHHDLAEWLFALPKPVGILAYDDAHARLIANTCLANGIRIPDDVTVLGVNNDEQICRSAYPPLSSIALATEQAGFDIAAALAEMMSGRPPASPLISISPTRAVQRQSTDILSIEDIQVGRALRFIRENSHRKLRVADLIPVAGLSRRALQDAFVRSLGRTPLEEIHISRAEYVARLLVQTKMSIGKVAEAAGFELDSHLSRFFARQTGLTPMAYRKKHQTL